MSPTSIFVPAAAMIPSRMRDCYHPKIEDVELTRLLHALSDPVRLDIVRQLASDGPRRSGAICGDKPKSSMSHHFRTLREAGVICTVIEGTTHLNSLRLDDLESRFGGLLRLILAHEPRSQSQGPRAGSSRLP